jgi:hypothetical protein
MGEFMNHKMVNLCDASKKVADDMKNFSKWVREELLKRSPKDNKEILHRVCGNFVLCEYDVNDQCWDGKCDTCNMWVEFR